MLAKLSNYFLLLVLGFLMLFGSFSIKAQSTSGKCEKGYVYDQVYDQVYEPEQESWYNTANGAWQTRTVWKYKWRYVWKCVPIPPKDGSTTLKDEKNNSATSTTSADVSSDRPVTSKPSKTLSKQILEKYNPIQLNSDVISGFLNAGNSRKPSYYTFMAVPGQLTINITIESQGNSEGNTIMVTLLDPNEKSLFGDGELAAIGSRLTMTNFGRTVQDSFEVKISEKMPVLLRIEPYNQGSGKYKIQLEGDFKSLGETKVKPDFNSVVGKWEGKWSMTGGSVFSAKMELENFNDANTIQGAITWKLESSSLPAQQSKIGFTGVEFVRGRYDPEARMLFLEGYRKDDPYEVIGLDKYRLEFSENGNSLTGASSNYGEWNAKFSLARE